MREFVLRRAADADSGVVLALLREESEAYRHRPDGPSGAFSDTIAGTRAMMAKVPVMLAVADETVVGCVFCAVEEDCCFLFRLGVLPIYQRRGIGGALIAYVEARAAELGLPWVRLGVRISMPENRAYYERYGYRVIAETEMGWTMEKRADAERTTYTIREVTDADVPTLVRVLRAAFAEQATLAPPSGALSETEASVRGLMRTARVALAEVDGAVAGCQFFEPKGDHLSLFRLAVLPAYRQLGIGGALIAYAEEQARALRLPRTQFSVRLALPRQRAYYERMGYSFIAYGTHAGFTDPTSATLAKDLTIIDGDGL